MSADPQLPKRIREDLEEALRDGGVDKLPNRPRRQRRKLRLRVPDPRPRNPGELVIIGAALFVAGLLPFVPFRFHLMGAGVLCLIVAFVTWRLQPHGHIRKYWRGRYLDVPTGQWQERLYRLIYRHD